jgi:hypothetical protein
MNHTAMALLLWAAFLAACSVEPIRPDDTYIRAQKFNEWWGQQNGLR